MGRRKGPLTPRPEGWGKEMVLDLVREAGREQKSYRVKMGEVAKSIGGKQSTLMAEVSKWKASDPEFEAKWQMAMTEATGLSIEARKGHRTPVSLKDKPEFKEQLRRFCEMYAKPASKGGCQLFKAAEAAGWQKTQFQRLRDPDMPGRYSEELVLLIRSIDEERKEELRRMKREAIEGMYELGEWKNLHKAISDEDNLILRYKQLAQRGEEIQVRHQHTHVMLGPIIGHEDYARIADEKQKALNSALEGAAAEILDATEVVEVEN